MVNMTSEPHNSGDNTPDHGPGGPAVGPVMFALITLAGMGFSLLGTMLPEISRAYHLTATQAASLPLAQFGGDFAGLLLLGFLLSRPRALLVGGALALALGAFAIASAGSFSLFLKISFFAYGASVGVLATLPGLAAARLDPDRAGHAMSMLYGAFSAGVMASPLIAGALLAGPLSYRAVFAGFGALAAGAAVLAAARMPGPGLGAGLARGPILRLLSRPNRRLFFVPAAMTMLYVAAETVPNAYIPKYLSETFPGGPDFRGALTLSLFWGAITLGRFVCAAALGRGLPPRRTLAALAILACACLLPAAWTTRRAAAEALFIAAGLFLSGIFPIIVSYSGRADPDAAGTMFILLQAAGMMGAALSGKAVGLIADHLGFSAGMTLAIPLALAVLALAPLLPGAVPAKIPTSD
jgi:fucose permease